MRRGGEENFGGRNEGRRRLAIVSWSSRFECSLTASDFLFASRMPKLSSYVGSETSTFKLDISHGFKIAMVKLKRPQNRKRCPCRVSIDSLVEEGLLLFGAFLILATSNNKCPCTEDQLNTTSVPTIPLTVQSDQELQFAKLTQSIFILRMSKKAYMFVEGLNQDRQWPVASGFVAYQSPTTPNTITAAQKINALRSLLMQNNVR